MDKACKSSSQGISYNSLQHGYYSRLKFIALCSIIKIFINIPAHRDIVPLPKLLFLSHSELLGFLKLGELFKPLIVDQSARLGLKLEKE